METDMDLDVMESETECPLRYLQNLLGGKWKMPIVCMLAAGTPLRNATIRRRLGSITSTMLSQTLKELEADGMIERKQFNEVPPHVEYSLAERGKSVIPNPHARIAGTTSNKSRLADFYSNINGTRRMGYRPDVEAM